MKKQAYVTLWACDGCGNTSVQLDASTLPYGFMVDVVEVYKPSGSGQLYVCSESCLLPAFTRRAEVWMKEVPA